MTDSTQDSDVSQAKGEATPGPVDVGPTTPSMFASVGTMVAMILFILTSVALFGSEVADGALQVSITMATLVALGVAHHFGFRGSVITQAIQSGVGGSIGTVFVVLAIGSVIGTL